MYIKVCVQRLLLKWHAYLTHYVVLPWLQVLMFRNLFLLPSSDDKEKYTQPVQTEGSYRWLRFPLRVFFFFSTWRRRQNQCQSSVLLSQEKMLEMCSVGVVAIYLVWLIARKRVCGSAHVVEGRTQWSAGKGKLIAGCTQQYNSIEARTYALH